MKKGDTHEAAGGGETYRPSGMHLPKIEELPCRLTGGGETMHARSDKLL